MLCKQVTYFEVTNDLGMMETCSLFFMYKVFKFFTIPILNLLTRFCTKHFHFQQKNKNTWIRYHAHKVNNARV